MITSTDIPQMSIFFGQLLQVRFASHVFFNQLRQMRLVLCIFFAQLHQTRFVFPKQMKETIVRVLEESIVIERLSLCGFFEDGLHKLGWDRAIYAAMVEVL
jgi:hypothetical protein